MPATALQHFQEEIARAKAIVAHADPLPRTNAAEQLLRSPAQRLDVCCRRAGRLLLRCLHGSRSSHGQLEESAAGNHPPGMGVRHQAPDPGSSGGIRQHELAMANGGPQDDGTRERHQPASRQRAHLNKLQENTVKG